MKQCGKSTIQVGPQYPWIRDKRISESMIYKPMGDSPTGHTVEYGSGRISKTCRRHVPMAFTGNFGQKKLPPNIFRFSEKRGINHFIRHPEA